MEQYLETTRVAVLGSVGTIFTLSNINEVIGIFVGIATGVYVCTKIYFLIKNKGK